MSFSDGPILGGLLFIIYHKLSDSWPKAVFWSILMTIDASLLLPFVVSLIGLLRT